MKVSTTYPLNDLRKGLSNYNVKLEYITGLLRFTSGKKIISFRLADDQYNFSEYASEPFIANDLLQTAPGKIAAMILSRLQLNKSVFARNCEVRKIDKNAAEKFINYYHLMSPTQSAYNYGLFLKDELLAVASFSKGRKMDRLSDDKRSFELIRFCCKSGISITGGLTKLIKKFYLEKNAGDIMTYIDKQWSNGDSFIKAGFIKAGETPEHYFLIDRKTFERHYTKEKPEEFDRKKFYLTQNLGNIKLIFTPKN